MTFWPHSSLSVWRKIVVVFDNRCRVPHNHPQPIPQAQMYHQPVIEHSSLLEATGPSSPPPPPPHQMSEGRKCHFLPFGEMVQKTEAREKRPRVSINPTYAVLTSCETSSRCTHLSVRKWYGVWGLLLEAAANPPFLHGCIIQCFSHNSLYLKRLSSPSHAASSLLIREMLRTHCVAPLEFLAVHILS